MRALLISFFLALGFLLLPAPAPAQGWVDQPFDPAQMSREDTATLQAALAYSGDYYGFTDGIWNSDAQTALEAWVKREEGASRPLFRHLNRLVMALEDERVKSGWQLFYSDQTNVSYLHPFQLLKSVDNKDAIEFLSEDSGFSVMVRFSDEPAMKDIHDWFLSQAVSDSKPYQFNDSSLWITSVSMADQMTAYARSDFHNGGWSTISIVVRPEYFYDLNLMAASMTVGGSPASLMWTDGGVIDQVINGGSNPSAPVAATGDGGPKDQVRRPVPEGTAEMPEPDPLPKPDPLPESGSDGTVAIADNAAGISSPPLGSNPGSAPIPGGSAAPVPDPADPPQPGGGGVIGTGDTGSPPIREADAPRASTETATAPTADNSSPKVTGTVKGSGSAFYIAPTMLLTAAHVVEKCGAVAMVDGTQLDIIGIDTSLDMAVLGGATDAGAWLRLRATDVPTLGAEVTALGYPYFTSLDQGLTVTNGNISALRGTDGSEHVAMISAPVQPGNSGGPVLNKKGAVVGMVVSRLDDFAMLEETGSLPQNMAFAVKKGQLLTFLGEQRVELPQGVGTGGDVSDEVPPGVANAVIPLYCYE